jgi:hypothetical protein
MDTKMQTTHENSTKPLDSTMATAQVRSAPLRAPPPELHSLSPHTANLVTKPTIFEAQRSALCAGAARGDKLPWPKLA